jgi:hypothetical protein
VSRFPAFTFSVGSTKEAVLEVQGMPTDFNEHVWWYGSSRIFFKDDKVTGWEIGSDSPLRVKTDGAKNN